MSVIIWLFFGFYTDQMMFWKWLGLFLSLLFSIFQTFFRDNFLVLSNMLIVTFLGLFIGLIALMSNFNLFFRNRKSFCNWISFGLSFTWWPFIHAFWTDWCFFFFYLLKYLLLRLIWWGFSWSSTCFYSNLWIGNWFFNVFGLGSLNLLILFFKVLLILFYVSFWSWFDFNISYDILLAFLFLL